MQSPLLRPGAPDFFLHRAVWSMFWSDSMWTDMLCCGSPSSTTFPLILPAPRACSARLDDGDAVSRVHVVSSNSFMSMMCCYSLVFVGHAALPCIVFRGCCQ